MLVWLLQIGEPTPSLGSGGKHHRTRMLASALVGRGHQVLWWTSTFDHYAKRHVANAGEAQEIELGLTVRFLPAFAYERNLSLRRYVSHIRTARAFRRAAWREPVPDIVVASMPDYHLAAEAVRYAGARRIPVVVDVRDEWPDVFLDIVPRWTRPFAAAALAPDRAKLRRLLREADGLTSVMDTMLSWALEKAGRTRRPADRVFYLGAEPMPSSDASRASPQTRRVLDAVVGRFVVAFVGMFGNLTSPAVIVEAARRLTGDREASQRVGFVLAGGGPEFESVTSAAAGLDNVFFPGWAEGGDLFAILQAASVGVVAYPRGLMAFPNKAFTYLAAGIPILASSEGDLKTLMQDRGFGLPFMGEDAKELAERIKFLLQHPEEVARMALAARRFFAEEGEAGKIYARFASYLEKSASPSPDRPTAPVSGPEV